MENKKRFIATKGLPASGKTTWAKKLCDDDKSFVRVNRDDIRAMQAGAWNEKLTLRVRNSILDTYALAGCNIVCDDTNFNPVHINYFKEFCNKNCYTFEVKDFTDVSLRTCLERDAKREKPVGFEVIYSMWRQYVYKERQPNGNPDCILVDIDGTVAEMNGRLPFDWKKVGNDLPIKKVVDMVNVLSTKYNVVFISGRDGECEEETRKWLQKYFTFNFELYMRKAGDNRKDSIIKREIILDQIEKKWNIVFCIDDRMQVVDELRSLGLTVFQVDYGMF